MRKSLFLAALFLAIWTQAIAQDGAIKRDETDVTTKELLESLRVRVLKFDIEAPKGAKRMKVWFEQWRRGQKKSLRFDVTEMLAPAGQDLKIGPTLIRLPSGGDSSIYIRTSGGGMWKREDNIHADSVWSARKQSLQLGKAATLLVTMRSRESSGGDTETGEDLDKIIQQNLEQNFNVLDEMNALKIQVDP